MMQSILVSMQLSGKEKQNTIILPGAVYAQAWEKHLWRNMKTLHVEQMDRFQGFFGLDSG